MKKDKQLWNIQPGEQKNCCLILKINYGSVLSQALCSLNFEFSQENRKKYDQKTQTYTKITKND